MQLITGRFLLTEACSAPIEVSTLYQRWSIFNAPEKFSLGEWLAFSATNFIGSVCRSGSSSSSAPWLFRCLRHSFPRYLSDFCTPVANVAARSQLCGPSDAVVVPRYNRSTYGRRAFSVAGPMTWNSLTDSLRDPSLSSDSFRRQLKTFLLDPVFSALEILSGADPEIWIRGREWVSSRPLLSIFLPLPVPSPSPFRPLPSP